MCRFTATPTFGFADEAASFLQAQPFYDFDSALTISSLVFARFGAVSVLTFARAKVRFWEGV